MNSLKSISRLAGFGYLIIFLTGIFANFFVIEGLVVPGDAAQTFQNIGGSQGLFRLGILAFIVMVIFDLILAWALYLLLKPVSPHLSLFQAWFRLVNGTIFGVALYKLVEVVQLAGGNFSSDVYSSGQLAAEVMRALEAFNTIWLLGLIFFGIHLVFLGYLVRKSDYIPGVLGILLIIAGVAYLVDSFANFMMVNYELYADIFMLIVVIPGVIGELSFTLWLLFRGVKDSSHHDDYHKSSSVFKSS